MSLTTSGSYERVKLYVRDRRPQILAEFGERDCRDQMHRGFEVLPGSQAQVDWGHEGTLCTPAGQCDRPSGTGPASLGLLEPPSGQIGGTVFNAGTTDWARVLVAEDGSSLAVQQITKNVIYALSVVPP